MSAAETVYPYITPRGIKTGETEHVPVIVVGAGPVGLAAAVDLALHGIKCILLDDNDRVSTGSRAICWAKRSLEILDRLGIGDRMLEKGVTWKVGRQFHRDREVYSFDLLPEAGYKMPAFVNLQQYYLEQFLIERAQQFPDLIELRWKNRVSDIFQNGKIVLATVDTPDGPYKLSADYLLACDGAHSTIRSLLNLGFNGEAFEERFLIADVMMEAEFPSERWFWFEPPFHNGQTALLHRQPDNVYRLDFALGPNADPAEEREPEKVVPRVRAMVGDRDFTFEWISVYNFQCRRLEKFVHDRIVFMGDAAHIVSIFGARGGNAGLQDADNLIWKLAAILKDEAPGSLLESYDEERISAANENALITTRTTRFMTPRSRMEKVFRKAVLDLAKDHAFARKLINSGRLSTPHALTASSLQTSSNSTIGVDPGLPCPDVPLEDGWLLNKLGGDFKILTTGFIPQGPLADLPHIEMNGDVAEQRYGRNTIYLIRPDQHVAARFTSYDVKAIDEAHQRALGRTI